MPMTSDPISPPPGLPADVTSFVGRDAELRDVLARLGAARIVTVTGSAGVGKTRLALRAAARSAHVYPDGVRLAELTSLSDPRRLGHAVADVLGLPRPSAPGDLGAGLGDRRMLLILDTCEHVIDACRGLAEEITERAPGVTVLATSRQRLGAREESVFLLGPLPVPETFAARAPGDAVDLFAQRAASVVPGFTVTGTNRDDVLRTCARLGGIPLAVELAAVRLRALDVRQLADGLDGRVLSLTGGRRTAHPRHRELRTAIRWSYDLCTAAEQELWTRLSVFAGPFDLASVTSVCACDSRPGPEIATALRGLAEKSVLSPDYGADGTPRFRMPGGIREYGAELLSGAGAEEKLRSRHIARYLGMARHLDADPMHDQPVKYRALRREHDDIRAAIEYALEVPGNDSAAVSIVTSLFLYWVISGLLREGEYWLDQVLRRCPAATPSRARLLIVRALLFIQLGEIGPARADAEAAIGIAASHGAADLAARARVVMHQALTWEDDLAEADVVAAEALPELRTAGDTAGLAMIYIQIALGHLQAKDPKSCSAACQEGLSGLPEGELWARGYLLGLGGCAQFMMGVVEPGAEAVRLGLSLNHKLGDTIAVAYGIGMLGIMAAGQGRLERAAWLLGASGTLWEHSGLRYAGHPFLEEQHRQAASAVAGGLGHERYRRLTALASTADVGEIVELALSDGNGVAALTQ